MIAAIHILAIAALQFVIAMASTTFLVEVIGVQSKARVVLISVAISTATGIYFVVTSL